MESMVANNYQSNFSAYVDHEKAAVSLQSSIGQLLFEKGIELVLFRNPLLDISISEILQLHDYANEIVNKPINVQDTSALAKELMNMELAPSKLDIGLLAAEYHAEKANDYKAFLEGKLAGFGSDAREPISPKDVVLYGFGRIGRLAARLLIKSAGRGQQLRLRAIVVRKIDKDQLASLAERKGMSLDDITRWLRPVLLDDN